MCLESTPCIDLVIMCYCVYVLQYWPRTAWGSRPLPYNEEEGVSPPQPRTITRPPEEKPELIKPHVTIQLSVSMTYMYFKPLFHAAFQFHETCTRG